jgi:hypothetical protein
MKKQPLEPRSELRVAPASRRAQLQVLLFAGAALGTTLLTLGGALDPKLPPFKGE